MSGARRGRSVTRALLLASAAALTLSLLSRFEASPIRLRADPAVELLAREPASRLGLGGLQLDGDLSVATTALGPAHRVEDDIFGPSHLWLLGGTTLLVGVWEGSDQIGGLAASAAPGTATGVALHAGLQLGTFTLGELLDRWGEPDRYPTHPLDDYVAAYDSCIGPFPIVTKFDQPGVRRGAGFPAALDRVVTSVLIAYADEPPGTGGCTPPRERPIGPGPGWSAGAR